MKLNLLPARTGVQWLTLGLRTFAQQPIALTALFFLLMALLSLCSIVPILGTVLALGLLPLTTLVMMVAAQETSVGRRPLPSVLVAAWRAGQLELGPMLVLGGYYAFGFLLCMAISALFDGGQFAELYLVGGKLTAETVESGSFQLAMWAFLLLYLPLSLMFWHAPALVHWHGVAPVKSLFFSLVACWRNIGAFTVFGLGWLALMASAGLLMSMITLLLVTAAGLATAGVLTAGLMVLTVMVLATMLFTSSYFTFRDCFGLPEAHVER